MPNDPSPSNDHSNLPPYAYLYAYHSLREALEMFSQRQLQNHAISVSDDRDYFAAAVAAKAEGYRTFVGQIDALAEGMRQHLADYPESAVGFYLLLVSLYHYAEDAVRSFERLPAGTTVKKWENAHYLDMYGTRDIAFQIVTAAGLQLAEWQRAGWEVLEQRAKFPELLALAIESTLRGLPLYAVYSAQVLKGNVGVGPLLATAGMLRADRKLHGRDRRILASLPSRPNHNGKSYSRQLNGAIFTALPHALAGWNSLEYKTADAMLAELRSRVDTIMDEDELLVDSETTELDNETGKRKAARKFLSYEGEVVSPTGGEPDPSRWPEQGRDGLFPPEQQVMADHAALEQQKRWDAEVEEWRAAGLTEQQVAILYLEREGIYKQGEIALMLNTTTNNVKSQKSQALRKLRQYRQRHEAQPA